MELLFSTRSDLERYTFSAMTPIAFQARDGMQLFGYLTLPVGKDPKHLPVIVFVHGGPWERDSWGFQPAV